MFHIIYINKVYTVCFDTYIHIYIPYIFLFASKLVESIPLVNRTSIICSWKKRKNPWICEMSVYCRVNFLLFWWRDHQSNLHRNRHIIFYIFDFNTSELMRYYISHVICVPKRNSLRATNPNLNVCTAYREASWGTKSHRIVDHPCHAVLISANGCMQWLGQSWPFGRLVSLTKSWLDFYHFLRIYNRNNNLVWASQAALENGLSQLIHRGNLGHLKKPWKRNTKSNGTSQNPWNKMKQHENTYGFQCKRTWIWFGDLWLSPVWRHPYSVCTWRLTNDGKVGT